MADEIQHAIKTYMPDIKCLRFAHAILVPACVGIIIAIEYNNNNNNSNNNYNGNYVLSISKFNKWFEWRAKQKKKIL